MISYYDKIKALDIDYDYNTVFNVDGSKSFYFGKDSDENIIFLIRPSDSAANISAISSKGKFLDISFNTTLEFKLKGDVEDGEFTMLTLKTKQKLMGSIFISMCVDLIELIGEEPSYEQVVAVVKSLRDLFLNFMKPATHDEIGLWGELFVISQAADAKNAIDSWHLNPSDTFDFNDGRYKMEVKTTTQNQRVHAISLNQILKSIETESLVCSIMTSKIDLGKDLIDLKSLIDSKLNNEYRQKLNNKIISAAGDKWNQYNNKYDFTTAQSSMEYYNALDIPTINPAGIDLNISNVKFSVNLESTEDVDIEGMKVDCQYLPH